MNNMLFYAVPAMGLIGLLYTFIKFAWVSKQDAGNPRMKEISDFIAEGAMAFLKAEWKILAYFVVIVALLLGFMANSNESSHWSIAIAFIIGAVFSATAGYIGMKVATKANVRTAEAAKTSLSRALKVSFTGGSVMGMGVSGLAVLGLGGLFLILKHYFSPDGDAEGMLRTIEILTGFSLGAESIALFARVGGGIYTKAADVGADLVGKVEAGIPEDDPRNPATIADNVGDNVGDVAGMGADLFGSYVATVLATMVLGQEVTGANKAPLVDAFGGLSPILLPMLIAGIGIILSIIGTLFVRISDKAGLNTATVQNALNMGNYGSMVLTAVVCYFLVGNVLPETMFLRGLEFTRNGVIGAIGVGLVVGVLMSIITEYYTAMGKRPVLSIIKQSSTGHATNIIGGLAIGMESTFLPILVLAAGIFGSFYCAGLYGVAIAAAGMMATTGMQLAIDAFGPIADNAGGAWDNAKKSFEKGVEINGEMFYKKSEPHKASVTGDTVGDPFKDTSGPSMNILIKLMSIVSLVIAPTLAKMHPTSSNTVTKSQFIEMSIISTDTSKALVDTANTVTMSTDSKTLVQALQEDGLAPKDNVKIEVKDGNISVNGKALTPEQNEKYKSYLHIKMAIKQ